MTMDYYVIKGKSGLLELRQERFRNTPNHPHDVCALARDVEEMKDMVARNLPAWEVDYSAVQPRAN
jgi:hypothetical protein